jgi:hypothetical protein
VPTPEKAANVREKTVARILKNHRVRRFDASHELAELRKPALAVACPGGRDVSKRAPGAGVFTQPRPEADIKRHSITSWARNRNASGIDLSFLLPIPSSGYVN